MVRKIAILFLTQTLVFSVFAAVAADVSPDKYRNVADSKLYHVVHSFSSWAGIVLTVISGE